LSGLAGQSLADRKTRPLEITPLATPLVPIDVPLAESVSASVTGATVRKQSMAGITGAEVRARLASASGLREIALLTEILQPPLALRRPRRSR
jgi:hypothetical protein